MVKASAINLGIDVNHVGFKLTGGTSSPRGFSVAGSSDFTLVSQVSTGTLTLPNAVASTLLGSDSFSAKGDLLTATSSGTPSILSVGTNGYVLTANTGASTGMAWAAPGSGGSGISVRESITANQTLLINRGYYVVANSLTLTLPATAPLGSVIAVSLTSASNASFKIKPGTGQQMLVASVLTNVSSGYVQSTAKGDSVTLECVVENVLWQTTSVMGVPAVSVAGS